MYWAKKCQKLFRFYNNANRTLFKKQQIGYFEHLEEQQHTHTRDINILMLLLEIVTYLLTSIHSVENFTFYTKQLQKIFLTVRGVPYYCKDRYKQFDVLRSCDTINEITIITFKQFNSMWKGWNIHFKQSEG